MSVNVCTPVKAHKNNSSVANNHAIVYQLTGALWTLWLSVRSTLCTYSLTSYWNTVNNPHDHSGPYWTAIYDMTDLPNHCAGDLYLNTYAVPRLRSLPFVFVMSLCHRVAALLIASVHPTARQSKSSKRPGQHQEGKHHYQVVTEVRLWILRVRGAEQRGYDCHIDAGQSTVVRVSVLEK